MSRNEFESDGASAQLAIVVKLLAHIAVSAVPSLKERAVILSGVGLSPKQIAEICGTTAHSVSVMLSSARKKKVRR